MADRQFILDFYQQIAKHYALSPQSSMEDQTIRERETQFIIQEVHDFIMTHEFMPRVIDLGCGNGHLLSCLRQKFCDLELFGLELSPELSELAKSRKLANTEIICADMCDLECYPIQPFHIFITERSLINLDGWRQQEMALSNILTKSSFPTRVICIESYTDGLLELNAARREMNLPEIRPSIQNVYLSEKKVTRWFEKAGFFERQTSLPKNSLSPHFFHTRVFHPSLRVQGSKVKPARFIDFLDHHFTDPTGNYSPILLKSFEKTL